MKHTFKTIVASCLTVILALVLITAGSFALFTDEAKISNHLVAGNLELQLTRTAHSSKVVDAATGAGTTRAAATESVDFTGVTGENAFGLQDGDLIVPGSELSATFTLKNVGNVRFGYWVELVLTDDAGTVLDPSAYTEDLAKQLKVSFNGQATPVALSTGSIALGSETDLTLVEATQTSAAFTVKVEFEDREDNNDAQDEHVYFDIKVYAIQSTF